MSGKRETTQPGMPGIPDIAGRTVTTLNKSPS
jgi:hypothetical protein